MSDLERNCAIVMGSSMKISTQHGAGVREASKMLGTGKGCQENGQCHNALV